MVNLLLLNICQYSLFINVENYITKFLPQFYFIVQKQHFRCVLKKRYSENMQQFCRRAPMSKCDFNKVGTAVIPNSGNEYFSKTLDTHISGIYFSLIFSPIFSKAVFAYNKFFQFKKCGILYRVPFKIQLKAPVKIEVTMRRCPVKKPL